MQQAPSLRPSWAAAAATARAGPSQVCQLSPLTAQWHSCDYSNLQPCTPSDVDLSPEHHVKKEMNQA